jgi:hypothetical protein
MTTTFNAYPDLLGGMSETPRTSLETKLMQKLKKVKKKCRKLKNNVMKLMKNIRLNSHVTQKIGVLLKNNALPMRRNKKMNPSSQKLRMRLLRPFLPYYQLSLDYLQLNGLHARKN